MRTSEDEIKISEVATSRDSKTFVAFMSDSSVQLWTLRQEKWSCIVFTEYSDKIWKVAIGLDGTRFVCLSSEDTIFFWFKSEDENRHRTVDKELGFIVHFDLSGDANSVVLVSKIEARFVVYVFQLGDEGKLIKIEELLKDIIGVSINKTGICV